MTTPLHRVCLLLGSNIRPEENLPRAVELLAGRIQLLACSHAWQTSAVGSPGPDFLNAALLAQTTLPARALKQQILRPVEAQLGRVRTSDKNAPRTLDVDIVAWDGRVSDSDLWQRVHMAVPVAELLPGLMHAGEPLHTVAARLSAAVPVILREEVNLTR